MASYTTKSTPTLTSTGGTPGWNAVDLRTGSLLWHKDTNDTLDFGMVLQFHTIQEYGTQTWLVAQGPSAGSPSYSVWQLFDQAQVDICGNSGIARYFRMRLCWNVFLFPVSKLGVDR